MGYRCVETSKKGRTCNYRAMVVLLKKIPGVAEDNSVVVLTVMDDCETLKFVNENMEVIGANLVGVKKMNAQRKTHVEESSQLFQTNLKPLFTLISATTKHHVMDKLSVSLKKALLLMAMERYSYDDESICRALGITKGKLEKELKRCGLQHQERSAA